MPIRLSALEDKMHKKLRSQGIPEEIAAYVSDDRNSFPSAKRKFVALAILQRYEEEGEEGPLDEFLGIIREDLQDIRDWLRFARAEDGGDINMHLYRTFGDMLAAANAWHEQLASKGEGHPALYRDTGPEWTERTFPNGWKIIRVSPRDATNEGDMMGHCVGSYAKDISSGKCRIYSLRDPGGEPHVTIEIQPDGDIDDEINIAVEAARDDIIREEYPKFAVNPGYSEPTDLDRPLFDRADLNGIPMDYNPSVSTIPAVDEKEFVTEHYDYYRTKMSDAQAYFKAQEEWERWQAHLEEALDEYRESLGEDENWMNEVYYDAGWHIEQIKGQANTAPKHEYRGMLRDFARNNLGWDGDHREDTNDTYYLEDDDYFWDSLENNPEYYRYYGKYLSPEGKIELCDHYLKNEDDWSIIAGEQDLPELVLGRALQILAERQPSQLAWTGPQDAEDWDEEERYRNETTGDVGAAIAYIDHLRGKGVDYWERSLRQLAKDSREHGRYGTLEHLAEAPGGAQVLEQMIADETSPEVLRSLMLHTRDQDTLDFLDARMAEVALAAGKKMIHPEEGPALPLADIEARKWLQAAMRTPGLSPERRKEFYDLYISSGVTPQFLTAELDSVLGGIDDREGRQQLLSFADPETVNSLRERVKDQRGLANPGMHELLDLEPPEVPHPRRLLDASLVKKMIKLSDALDEVGLSVHADSIMRSTRWEG